MIEELLAELKDFAEKVLQKLKGLVEEEPVELEDSVEEVIAEDLAVEVPDLLELSFLLDDFSNFKTLLCF